MKAISIKMYNDDHDCDTCGTNWAEGGDVYVDGDLVLSRRPSASCFGGSNFSEHDLLVMALKKIGVDLTVDGRPFDVCCHDDEYHGFPLGPHS